MNCKEPKFTADGEKAWKLVDLQNLLVYFDHELLGDLDGRNILVSIICSFHFIIYIIYCYPVYVLCAAKDIVIGRGVHIYSMSIYTVCVIGNIHV